MKAQNIIGHYSMKKEMIRFETDLEKKFHKIISRIRFGEKIDIPVMAKTKEDKKNVSNAIKKSSLYNNVDIKQRWSKDETYITISVERI